MIGPNRVHKILVVITLRGPPVHLGWQRSFVATERGSATPCSQSQRGGSVTCEGGERRRSSCGSTATKTLRLRRFRGCPHRPTLTALMQAAGVVSLSRKVAK
jgi:hypothetical protein